MILLLPILLIVLNFLVFFTSQRCGDFPQLLLLIRVPSLFCSNQHLFDDCISFGI